MAEGNNKLYITISDVREGDGETPTEQPEGTAESEKSKDNALGRYIEHQVFHLAKKQAMKFVHFTFGSVGNFTGDYIAQQQINDIMSSIQPFVNIGLATAAGAKVGGWVGAIVGFAVGTVSETVGSVYTIRQKEFETVKTNYEIEQLKVRSGLNSLLDGSRGTEN